MAQQIEIGDSVFTKTNDIAIVTRIEKRRGEMQVYGLLCTGPLSNSTNGRGDLNEFLLSIAA